jgi:hypothetical protein
VPDIEDGLYRLLERLCDRQRLEEADLDGLRELHASGLATRPLTASNRTHVQRTVYAVHCLATDEGRRVVEERRGRG